MTNCEFEEKQYEVQYIADLVRNHPGGVQLAPAGQAMEAYLGFDLGAMVNAIHPAWTPTTNPQFPPGVSGKTIASRLPASKQNRIPNYNLNLFLQFKRSDFLHGHSATHRRSKYFPGPIIVSISTIEQTEVLTEASIRR